ncbi:MAG: ectoine/hydroxyectoine ABC transporter substrate-binding protein EhuB [Myxococcales bacterium]|jgi:polar amino acid transport system substrate-binding protein
MAHAPKHGRSLRCQLDRPWWAGSARALLVLLVWPATSCDGSVEPVDTTLERIQQSGVVRIAYANEAPYGYRDIESGRVTGEAPEIARVILRRLGVEKLEASLVDFGQLIPGLQAGRYDMIAAGMYITPERCQQIDFSNPTYAVGEAFLVRAGNPRHLHSFEDALQRGRLGVVGGTVEFQYAEKLGMPTTRLVVFPDNATALAGLRNDRIDAFAGTALTVRYLLDVAGVEDIEVAEPFEQPRLQEARPRSHGAFGFREQDDAFREAVNAELARFIGTQEHLALTKQFSFTRDELPGDVTAEDICGRGNL